MSRTTSWIMAILVLCFATGITWVLVAVKAEPTKKEPKITARTIRAIKAVSSDVPIIISSQGTVRSKQMINLVPQVSGEIIYVSKKFVVGGEFKAGEVILKIDPRDYEYAVITARSAVVEREQTLALEKQESVLAKEEWAALGQGKASDLTLRVPYLKAAKSRLDSAQASLNKAKLQLERSVIKAPFTGLLSAKNVDYKQFISAGTVLATFQSTKVMEVRLPFSRRDLSLFDVAALKKGNSDIHVALSSEYSNETKVWNGRIIRTEGVVNPKSRILFIVAELTGTELKSSQGNTSLGIGQFVTAKVEGKILKNKFIIPREALRKGNSVLIVDENNKLRTRIVEVFESNRKYVVVGTGIKEGDIICLSQLGMAVDGLFVEPEFEEYDLSTKGGL